MKRIFLTIACFSSFAPPKQSDAISSLGLQDLEGLETMIRLVVIKREEAYITKLYHASKDEEEKLTGTSKIDRDLDMCLDHIEGIYDLQGMLEGVLPSQEFDRAMVAYGLGSGDPRDSYAMRAHPALLRILGLKIEDLPTSVGCLGSILCAPAPVRRLMSADSDGQDSDSEYFLQRDVELILQRLVLLAKRVSRGSIIA